MNQQFLNLEILHRIANGNTMAYKSDQDSETSYKIAQEEIEIDIEYCQACGFPIESEYEKSIQCHVECK